MSDITVGVVTYLNTKAAVTNLVSTRIRPDALEQNATLPAIVVYEFGTTHAHQLSGGSGIYETRIRIDCYALTRIASSAVSEAVRGVTQGYRGLMGVEFIHSCEVDGRVSDIVSPKAASDSRQYRTRLALRMYVTESIPSF